MRAAVARHAGALALALGGAGPLALIGLPAAAQPAAASAPAPSLRPAPGKALMAAQDALRAGNAAEAMARLAEAEAMPDLTPYETYILRRLKGAAQVSQGSAGPALATFEAVLGSAELPAAERPALLQTAVSLALQLKDYPRAVPLIKAYLAAGGTDAQIRSVYPQVLQVTGDHAGVVREVTAQLAADEAAGRAPTEPRLRLLAASQQALSDDAGLQRTLERLAAATGKPDYWNDVLLRVAQADGFAADRLRLDWYRLRRAAGVPLSGDEWVDLTQRAMQAGFPAEAQAAADQAFSLNLMGQGADAATDRRLRDQVTKLASQDRAGLAESEASARRAADGNNLFALGLALSGAGQHAQGLQLMTAALSKGGLRRPEDARLQLGMVQWRAGQGDQALKTLAEVKGNDGPAALARLWTLLINSPARAAAR